MCRKYLSHEIMAYSLYISYFSKEEINRHVKQENKINCKQREKIFKG